MIHIDHNGTDRRGLQILRKQVLRGTQVAGDAHLRGDKDLPSDRLR